MSVAVAGWLVVLGIILATGAPAAVLTVTNIADNGPGTLRQAILDVNSSPGPHTIAFNLAGVGPFSIAPTNAFAAISNVVVIDGTTQPGFVDAPVVELNGTSAGVAASGLIVVGGGCTIKGLVINRFARHGILLMAGGTNVITGNYLGTDRTGAIRQGNQGANLAISNSPNNVVGGTTAAERNLISGSGDDGVDLLGSASRGNVIQGNYIGTDVTGTQRLENVWNGIWIAQGASSNVIGGTNAGSGNVISGNRNDGLEIQDATSRWNLIWGNRIGTDPGGTLVVSNGANGVLFENSGGNVVGGVSPSARNVISGNLRDGLRIAGTSATNNQVQGNVIGADLSGALNLGNFMHGINFTNYGETPLVGEPSRNVVGGVEAGEGNMIAFNRRAGVAISSGVNAVRGNSIVANGALGIDLGPAGVTANDSTDLDFGANNLMNFPVITNAFFGGGFTTIQGRLQSVGLVTYQLEFFFSPTADPSGYGQGQTLLGTNSVALGLSGTREFSVTFATADLVGQFVTATATGRQGDTSEFSLAWPVADGRPAVSSPPGSQVVKSGGDLTLSAGASGSAPLSYQWFFQGEAVVGATNATLSQSGVTAAQAGAYVVVVTNHIGSVTSAVANVTVLASGQLAAAQDSYIRTPSTPLNYGASTNLVVDRNGIGIGSQRVLLQFDLSSLPAGASVSNATLTMEAIENGGSINLDLYRVLEAWTEGASNGSSGVVNWNQRTTGTDWSTAGGSYDARAVATLRSGSVGQHRWNITRLVQDWLSGTATNYGLILGSSDNGSSTVTYSSREGATPPMLAIDYSSAPFILTQPQSQRVDPGVDISFRVEPGGTAPFGYQWMRDGVPLAGAVGPGYSLAAVSASAAGYYSVVITNALGAVTSAVARLRVNSAPILSGANSLAPIAQNEFTNSGTLVSNLLVGRVINPERGAREGIAVTSVEGANGTWQYTTNGAVSWFDFGTPTPAAARLLAADGDTRVRFVPATNWTGTVTNGLTFHAWNQTSGRAGGTADLRVSSVLDRFSVASYGNNDGLVDWGSDWVETDSNGAGPGSGRIRIEDGLLKLRSSAVGNELRRSADLGAAEEATLSLSYSNNLVSSDLIQLQVGGAGGFVVLDSFSPLRNPGDGSLEYDLTPYLAADLQVRLVVTDSGGGRDLLIDDLGIRSSATGGDTAFSVAEASAGVSVALSPVTLVMTDTFTNSVGNLEVSGSVQTNNVAATIEAGEPLHGGKPGGKSMWFVWRAPADGIASFSTQGSDFDTRLAVYQGNAVNSLAAVVSDDDTAGLLNAEVSFNVLADRVYQVAVDGAGGTSGHLLLSWAFEATADILPVITNQPVDRVVVVGSNSVFRVGAAGSDLSYQWYLNGAPVTGGTNDAWNVAGAGLPDVGQYWVQVSAGARTVRSRSARLQLDLNPGFQQEIEISDKFVDLLLSGVRLRLDPPPSAHASPPGVSPSGPIRGYSGSQVFSTVGSLKDPGEPNHCGVAGGASQWFAFQAEVDGVLALNTDGSTFDTVLAVYTGAGSDFASLTPLVCDNDSGTNGVTSSLHFLSTAGTVYYIAVDGVNGASGTVVLNYTTLGEQQGPTITVTSAPSVQAGLTNDVVAVAGTAYDESGLLAVQWRLTNSLGATTWTNTSGAESWSVVVSGLIIGTNSVQIRSIDTFGNVSATRALAYRRLAPLRITLDGCGTIASGLGGTTFHEPGSTVTLTALPCDDSLFGGWTGDATSGEPTVSVLNRTGLVLQASFVLNPFTRRAGNYAGLFYTTNEVAAERAGSFTLRANPKGLYSGRLRMGDRTRTFVGRIGLDGRSTNTVRPAGLEPALGLVLSFTSHEGIDGLTGQVLGGGWSAELAAYRSVYHARTNPSPFAGTYTLLLPANDQPGTPGGDGFGAVAVSGNGSVRLRGALPDGTVISQAAFVSRSGHWPLYLPLRGGRGAVWSWLTFESGEVAFGSQVVPGDLGGDLYWVARSSSVAPFYPVGFTNVLGAVGSRFVPPSSNTNGAFSFAQGEVVLSEGNLLVPVTNLVLRAVDDRFTDGGTNRLMLTVSRSSGLFRGGMADPGTSRPLLFKGAVFQNGDFGLGFFLQTNASGRVLIRPRVF